MLNRISHPVRSYRVLVASPTNVIIWPVDISLESVVYRVVLGVNTEKDFPLVYHIPVVTSITQAYKFVFRSQIYYV